MLSARRLTEAALAGGLLGFLQGLLFAGIITMLEPISEDERSKTIILTLIILVTGILAGAVLSCVIAYLNERRRNRAVA